MLELLFTRMRIAIAADHAGFELKEALRVWLSEQGHDVQDFGTHSTESTDYPDYAASVARRVASGDSERGILVCHTGIGMSIAANKITGIRAAVAFNNEAVMLTRSHNDANILSIGAKFTDLPAAEQFIDIFLSTSFEGSGRHSRRVGKIADLERTTEEQETAI